MGGAVPPLAQYTFMAWCSVGGSTGTTLPLIRVEYIIAFGFMGQLEAELQMTKEQENVFTYSSC
jgi:hypothetical protein